MGHFIQMQSSSRFVSFQFDALRFVSVGLIWFAFIIYFISYLEESPNNALNSVAARGPGKLHIS